MSIVIVIVTGLIIGSFLNAVIFRLSKGEPIFFKRSHCPTCGHLLSVFDLVPLLSFVFIGGRCRYCKAKISWQYPIIELATAIIFVLLFFSHGSRITDHGFWFQLIFAAILIVIAVYDFQHYLILDKVVWLALLLALIVNILTGQFILGILGAAMVAGFFGLQFLVSSGRWIGLGDVKLGLFLGALVGFSQSILLLVIAYTLGAVVGLSLVLLGKKSPQSRLPFGTFLAGSAITVMLYGDKIFAWYLGLIGI